VSVSARSVEITGLLRAWEAGDQAALDRLTPLIYEELHRSVRRRIGSDTIALQGHDPGLFRAGDGELDGSLVLQAAVERQELALQVLVLAEQHSELIVIFAGVSRRFHNAVESCRERSNRRLARAYRSTRSEAHLREHPSKREGRADRDDLFGDVVFHDARCFQYSNKIVGGERQSSSGKADQA
jgi:hypothetical protein